MASGSVVISGVTSGLDATEQRLEDFSCVEEHGVVGGVRVSTAPQAT